MAIGDKRLIELARGIASIQPVEREAACGTVTDWITSFDAREVGLLAALLASAAAQEEAPTCRESQLHALVELVDTGFVSSAHVMPLWQVDRDGLGITEAEYLDYLSDELR
ncbi:hypothetical protein AB8O64_13995 [Streptomyces sp. QH1-20]|uniref:hypothetical protein n=1 Tax=Streptomyces sp. QH1-20 TaxID=3240934 RepID=UPI003513C472